MRKRYKFCWRMGMFYSACDYKKGDTDSACDYKTRDTDKRAKRFELSTSSLARKRSKQLSYTRVRYRNIVA